jgi:hypothetical protein
MIDTNKGRGTDSPPPGGAPSLDSRASGFERDGALIKTVPEYIEKGRDLLRWWREQESTGGPKEKFRLARTFNQANRSYGFYGEAPVSGRVMPVMGNVQEMFYDQTRMPADRNAQTAQWSSEQMREFALKYWMRISSFRQPETYVDSATPVPPPALARLSWCPAPRASKVGFGFTQLAYQPSGGGNVRVFPTYDQTAIVDQRKVGSIYDWILLKVRIFDFNLNIQPLGDDGPGLVFALNEESHLAVHRDFVNDRPSPLPGVLGDYGIGYSFVKNTSPGPFGYGPGEFDAALELINFRVYETGYISVRMVFISNRPKQVTNVVVNPVNLGLRLADVFSFGLASQFLAPAKEMLSANPFKFTIDPVLGYVKVADAVSGGYSSQTLCISLEQLEKAFLVQHFRQHYQAVLGSLTTWRRFSDWLDEGSLPPWVISGTGS